MDQTDAPVQGDGGIQFQIGGQVKASAVLDHSLHDPFKEYNYGGSITSLDLDNIQPPSEMDGISYMGKMDSPQLNSMRNRKGLPGTLVARRAIAGGHNLNISLMKSVESVASNSNLENVAPPSLMDELLDSMISVDSITSEIASDPMKRTLCNGQTYGLGEMTNYETALSDNEDTMTLRSCRDLPLDGTASSSNCSSNQSTPVKRKTGRITPKMKRDMAKDRYKTYTVKDGLLNGVAAAIEDLPRDEEVQVVPQRAPEEATESSLHENNKSPKTSARQRRQENRNRFQTQILDYSEMKIFEIAPKDCGDVDEVIDVPNDAVPMETEVVEDMAIEEEKRKTSTVIKKTLMKLIKPASVATAIESPDTNKAVRGRRKPEYVSPYRRPVATTPKTSGNTTPKLTPRSSSTATTAGQTPKKTGLISKLKMATTSKKILTKEPKVEEQEVSPNKLDRQGTFTKDEPSSDNLPKVTSLPATPTRRISKLPMTAGNGVRKSYAGTPTLNLNGGAAVASKNGIMKRQISAPAPTLGEKRKSLIMAPNSKSSSGQLSERSTSTASIKSNNSSVRTPTNKAVERKLPLSMPTSRSNSTMSTPRTPTAMTPTSSTGKFSLYGRAKGLIPVTLSGKK